MDFPPHKYLRCDEAADLLRLAPATLRDWRHKGRGPRTVKIGGRVLWPTDGIREFILAAEAAEADRGQP